MDVFSLKQLEAIVEKLLEISKCPVCLEKVSTDSMHCVRGHFLCSGCKGAMQKCPLCDGAFSEDKTSVVTQQLVEALPSSCCHTGCQQFLAEDDEHEKYCGFRPTTCELGVCEWEGPGKDMDLHVEEIHKDDCTFKGSNESLIWSNYKHNSVKVGTNFVRAHGQCLWFTMRNNPSHERFTFTLKPIRNGKCVDDLYFKVVFTSSGPEFSCKIKLNLEPDAAEKENMIVVPWRSMPYYVNNEGDLAFQCYFTTS